MDVEMSVDDREGLTSILHSASPPPMLLWSMLAAVL